LRTPGHPHNPNAERIYQDFIRPAAPPRAAGRPAPDPGYGQKVQSRQPDVLVIGAGVSGLTTAICLAEAGLWVTVAAAQPAPQTTSVVAGAIWGPHLVGLDERVTRWGEVTLERLYALAGDPVTGVRLVSGLQASRDGQWSPPAWLSQAGRPARCDPAELPAGFAAGLRYTAPVVAMPLYLDYLLARLRRAGAQLRDDCSFASLAEAAEQFAAPVIVNCSGVGARHLVPDPAITPVRGQVVVVANPGVTEFFIGLGAGPDGLVYLIPHADTVVLGGTEDTGNWSLEPDPDTAERIVRDCVAIEPRIRGARVVAHRVGLRPTRPQVRLEAEDLGGGRRQLHNYGHGGAGVSLSWGCALDVTEAVLG
jgi:D-amino-acid oxidase